MKKRLLITGSSGLLGSTICYALRDEYDVVPWFRTRPVGLGGLPGVRLDLANAADVERAFAACRPDIVVHCAADTRVEYLETHPDEARQSNVVASANVSRAAHGHDAFLIHVSTDSVFDGTRQFSTEGDRPKPLNVYAASKAEAERAVLANCPSALVIRTCIYGVSILEPRHLLDWILSRLRTGQDVPGFADAFFNPVSTIQFSEIVPKLLGPRPSGVLHVASQRRLSKFEFAELVAKEFGFPSSRVIRSRLSEAPTIARRPQDTSLASTRWARIQPGPLPSIEAGVRAMAKLTSEGYFGTARAFLSGGSNG